MPRGRPKKITQNNEEETLNEDETQETQEIESTEELTRNEFAELLKNSGGSKPKGGKVDRQRDFLVALTEIVGDIIINDMPSPAGVATAQTIAEKLGIKSARNHGKKLEENKLVECIRYKGKNVYIITEEGKNSLA